MKKTLFAVAGLMMIASCNNDDVLQDDVITDEGRLVTVTTTLPGDTPDSRVVLTEENSDTDSRRIKVEWKESGETFSVMTATSEVSQTFTQTEGNDFGGTLTDGWSQPYYAFYPATDAAHAAEVPYDLSTQTGTLEGMTNYMYAVNTTDGKEYNFKHLTAIVKFTLNLPDNYTPTSLSLVSDRLLAKGTVNLTGENMVYSNELSAHSITVANPTVTDGKIVLYLNVLPMVASADSKNTLHIRTHDGTKGYSGSIATSKEIKAGKFYTATVDVNTHDYDYDSTTGYTVHSAWGLRAWGDNTSISMKCTLGDNDIDMGVLPNDIEIEGFAGNWKTIKRSANIFVFNGNKKTISNLRIASGALTQAEVGFINYLGNGATFKDVTFKGAVVAVDLLTGTVKTLRIGIAAGLANSSSKISDVIIDPNPDSSEPMFYISGSDGTTSLSLGAVVGYISVGGCIKDCVNNQDITIKDMNGNGISCKFLWCGGISAFANEDSYLIQCVNNGNINVSNVTVAGVNKYVGGISFMQNGNFIACANTGTISAPAKFSVAGIGCACQCWWLWLLYNNSCHL